MSIFLPQITDSGWRWIVYSYFRVMLVSDCFSVVTTHWCISQLTRPQTQPLDGCTIDKKLPTFHTVGLPGSQCCLSLFCLSIFHRILKSYYDSSKLGETWRTHHTHSSWLYLYYYCLISLALNPTKYATIITTITTLEYVTISPYLVLNARRPALTLQSAVSHRALSGH